MCRGRLGLGTLLLSCCLCLVWPSPGLAATDAAQGVLDPRLGLGHFHLERRGSQVAATVVAVRVQWPHGHMPVLFTVPEGFRPAQTVKGSVWAVGLEGQATTGLEMQVDPSGAVVLTADRAPAMTGLVRYATALAWTTPEPYLWVAGWHPRGVYRLERRGSEVEATVAATSIYTLSGHKPLELFTVPVGMRPGTTVHWQAVQSGMTRYVFEVTPAGVVSYRRYPLATFDRYHSENYETKVSWHTENYETKVSWHTADPPRLVTEGAYAQQPVDGSGVYHLQRQGEEATLTLAAHAVPVPTWMRPDLHRLPTLRIHPSAGIHPISDAKVYVDPHPVWLVDPVPDWLRDAPTIPGLEPGAPDHHPILGRSERSDNPYFRILVLPPLYWQIRLPDGRTGWIDQFATMVDGDVSRVPVTDRLFDVPPGFQPVATVTWEVDAQPVDAAGRPLAARTERLSLQVGNRLRYGAGVEGTTPGYYRYATQQRWTVGTDVCQRSWPVQAAILQAVAQQLNRDNPTCEAISWADLAALRSLTISLSRYKSPGYFDLPGELTSQNSWPRAFDLGGLAGLQELHLLEEAAAYGRFERRQFETLALPPDFLVHTPRLRSLVLARVRGTSPEFLVHTPELRSLTLALGSDPAMSTVQPGSPLVLPAGFLAYTPELQSLHLDLRDIKTLPAGFLGATPKLQEMVLEARDLTHLPVHFLAQAPQLRALRLQADALQYLPSAFLAHTPKLRTLVLQMGAVPPSDMWVLDNFMSHTPQLHTLVLEAGSLRNLPSDLLDHFPRLHTLWLTLKEPVAPSPGRGSVLGETEREYPLPERFLVEAPQLRSLYLHLPSGERLPEGFLSSTPRLQELVLTAEALTRLPEGFLAHAPNLQCLTVPTGFRLSAWASIPECPEPATPFGMDRSRPGFVPNMG